jgi:uncharacterized LabA/DUF88 family protein
MVPTAVLVDGAYFLRRYSRTYGPAHPPDRIAKNLFKMCIKHLEDRRDLYRIFFYDCPPLGKKAHHPITGEAVNFSKTPSFSFRTRLHRELVRQRKVALRLGRLGGTGSWVIKPAATKALLAGKRNIADLSPADVFYDISQKGVDMRIGLDIASLAHKRLVGRIILVTGDADFVPAAKHARREGIDVILDPMWQKISDDLLEHIDGLSSNCPQPKGMQKSSSG